MWLLDRNFQQRNLRDEGNPPEFVLLLQSQGDMQPKFNICLNRVWVNVQNICQKRHLNVYMLHVWG